MGMRITHHMQINDGGNWIPGAKTITSVRREHGGGSILLMRVARLIFHVYVNRRELETELFQKEKWAFALIFPWAGK